MLNLLCANNAIIMPIILVVMVVLMFAMSYFPNRKRKKAAQEMKKSIRVGKQIRTIGGFVGEIVSLDEKNGTMELNVGTKNSPVIVVMHQAAIDIVLNPDVPVKEQEKPQPVDDGVPTAVTAEDAEQDAIKAEKDAAKKAKMDSKKKEKEAKKAAKKESENKEISAEPVPETDENAQNAEGAVDVEVGEVSH